MLNYHSLKNKPRTFRSLTSLDVTEFEALVPSFEAAWQSYVDERWVQGRERQRGYGAGRRPILYAIEDKLLFILLYFKLYPLQEVQGLLFGLSQPQANEWIARLTPVLQKALGFEKQLPERKPQNLEQVLSGCVGLEFFIDGTERRINRPQDAERQKLNYSGKKKSHTCKNLLLSDRQCRVHYLSGTYEGKKHDKAIADDEEYRFPPGSTLYQDTGFQGYKPTTAPETDASETSPIETPPPVCILQPKKKPRGGQLSDAEKESNRLISRVRIKVEHAISGVKRCRIVKDIWRNHRDKYDDLVMETSCGLHNFRITQRMAAA